MSIDKFGRVFNNEEKGGVIGITAAGDFNAFFKRIENVAFPYRDKDAANADFVLKKVAPCMKLKVGGFFDSRNSIIRHVKDPVDDDDAVNKKYLQSLIPIKLTDAYSIGNSRLQDVAFPTSLGDAVNLKYITDNCVLYDNGAIQGKNNMIKNIKEGFEDNDATTIAHVRRIIKENEDKINKRIITLGRSLFHHIHGVGRASSTGLTEDNYLDWNKILS